MMSIVTESGSQEKFSFGEIKYRDDKTKLIEEIRLLNDQNKILKNRIRDSIREIKEREKDVQSWRSGFFSIFKDIPVISACIELFETIWKLYRPINCLNFRRILTNNR